MTVTDGPTQLVLRWAWEFPSAWRYSSLSGNASDSPYSMSVCTSGSAFSLIVTPAVVCIENTTHSPFLTPDSLTILRTSAVTSTIWLFPVATSISEYPLGSMEPPCYAGI